MDRLRERRTSNPGMLGSHLSLIGRTLSTFAPERLADGCTVAAWCQWHLWPTIHGTRTDTIRAPHHGFATSNLLP